MGAITKSALGNRLIGTMILLSLLGLSAQVNAVQLNVSSKKQINDMQLLSLMNQPNSLAQIASSATNLVQTKNSADEESATISDAEIEASQEIDNMSLSDIIQLRFKNNTHITEVKTPQEVAQVIIKGPEEANLEINVEVDKKTQAEYQKSIVISKQIECIHGVI